MGLYITLYTERPGEKQKGWCFGKTFVGAFNLPGWDWKDDEDHGWSTLDISTEEMKRQLIDRMIFLMMGLPQERRKDFLDMDKAIRALPSLDTKRDNIFMVIA